MKTVQRKGVTLPKVTPARRNDAPKVMNAAESNKTGEPSPFTAARAGTRPPGRTMMND